MNFGGSRLALVRSIDALDATGAKSVLQTEFCDGPGTGIPPDFPFSSRDRVDGACGERDVAVTVRSPTLTPN